VDSIFEWVLKEVVDVVEEVVGVWGGYGLLFGFLRGFLGGVVSPADKSNRERYATGVFTA
jgi:hypothetical protein